MAKKTINPIEQHIEKGVFGLAALALLGSIGYFLILGMPYQAAGWSGDTIKPQQLGTALEDQGKRISDKWRSVGPPPPPDPKATQTPQVDVGNGVFTLLKQYSDLKDRVFPALPPPPPLVEDERPTTAEKRPLVRIVAPGRPWAAIHKNVLAVPNEEPLESVVENGKLPDSTAPFGDATEGTTWAMCAAVVDLSAQEQEFIAANYPSNRQDLTVYDVQLQRRRVFRTAGGENSEAWRDVDAWVPFVRPPAPEPDFMPDGSISAGDRGQIESLWNLLRPGQKWILRPDRPITSKGSKVTEFVIPFLKEEPVGWFDPEKPQNVPPNPTITNAMRNWVKEATAAKDASTPDLDRAYMYAEAAYWTLGIAVKDRDQNAKLLDELDRVSTQQGRQPPKRELRRRMPIIAYDLNVEPGAYYQYRIRLRALNRFAGRPFELAEPADVRRVLVEGNWSEPSAVLEAPSDTYLYLINADEGKREATVEVFRKAGKAFEGKKFTVSVGDLIGRKDRKADFTTGAVVVDIDFKRSYRSAARGDGGSETTVALVYTEANHPERLHELILARDKIDSKRQELGGK